MKKRTLVRSKPVRRGKFDSPKVRVRKTKKFGRAVFAIKHIRKGEVVAVFDGPILDEEFDDWTDELLIYPIQFAKEKWRDSIGIARWINHSCDPNCGIKQLFKIVAMRAIAPGEQVTWDYEMSEKSTWMKMKCLCGSPLCRKRIGNYKNMPLVTRKKYAGFISKWLLG